MSAEHDIHRDETMTIRLLADEAGDTTALQRLAEREGTLLPTGPVLGAWVDDRLLAAVSLGDERGSVLADPFQASAGAASILASRAGQIRGGGRSRGRRIRDALRRPRAGLGGSPPGAGGRLLRL